MITPIMIAIVVDALRAVPKNWTEGALSLGINRWRAMWTVTVRAARPAIVAAAVLATARALGEAIMLSMVTGSVGFAPNPADGLIFFFEPARPLAPAIVDNSEGLSVVPFGETLYAFAAVLLDLGRLPVLLRLVRPPAAAALHALADMSGRPRAEARDARSPRTAGGRGTAAIPCPGSSCRAATSRC